MDGETVQWMKRIAAEKKIILTGSIIIKEEGQTETVKPSITTALSGCCPMGNMVFMINVIVLLTRERMSSSPREQKIDCFSERMENKFIGML